MKFALLMIVTMVLVACQPTPPSAPAPQGYYEPGMSAACDAHPHEGWCP